MNRKTTTVLAAAIAPAFALMFGSAAPSQAAPISYSTGFEQAAFNAGNDVPSIGSLNGWFREDGSPTVTAVPDVDITNLAASGGVQSMRFLNQSPFNQLDPGSVTYSISPVASLAGAADLIANGTPFVHIAWDMRVDDPGDQDVNKTSDTWCLDVYDSTANIRTMSVARGTEWDSVNLLPRVYTTDAAGQFIGSAVGVAPGSGVWGTYEIDLDYLAQTFTVSLNSVPLAFNMPMNVLADNGMDINFSVNGRGIDVAYFDNFSVIAVPEPGTIGVAGLCLAGAMARRRQR